MLGPWLGIGLALLSATARGEIRVLTERAPDGAEFAFQGVPPPARDDAASTAEFKLIDGEPDRNGGSLDVLHDGLVPTEEDQPRRNFFFQAGTKGGRIRIDLGSIRSVKQVNTYSWHGGTRGPQVYRLFAADGEGAGFNAELSTGTDPATVGWKFVARADTRPSSGEPGGQYGVTIGDPDAAQIGRYRYLLFEIERTEAEDAFGNTFYSEIDVVDADAPTPTPVALARTRERIVRSFEAGDGRYRFTLEMTAAPDLVDWAEARLRPVVQTWYPKLVAMLPSDGFEASTNLTLRFRDDMGGTPASASGNRLNLNSGWFRKELDREALGAVVHELVHVVQDYGRARRMNPAATRTPGWVVEGIADYIRWFLYEPESRGAEITPSRASRARYDASYRVTANFMDWVARKYDAQLVRKLNAAAREGRYAESLWQEWTGRPLPELGSEWREALGAPQP